MAKLAATMLAVTIFSGLSGGLMASPGTPPTAEPRVRQGHVPDWQIAAGGKMAFEDATVKQNKSGPPPGGDKPRSNVALDAGDTHADAGTELDATAFPLLSYIGFAYKISGRQLGSVLTQLPPWARTERFDIHARAKESLTKDQMRLVMQAVLADRFKLAVHYEPRQTPVFAMTLDKPGKFGPQLQAYTEGSPCAVDARPRKSASDPPPITIRRGGLPGFPAVCGGFSPFEGPRGMLLAGARNVSMDMIATILNAVAELDRPLLNKTGQSGTFDFIIEFAPPLAGPAPPAGVKVDQSAPTFQQALQEQLGLKLNAEIGPVDTLVVDHVEEPSAK